MAAAVPRHGARRVPGDPDDPGAELVQAAPQDFLAHPGNWMQWISDWRGTATAGPNFSWVLATRALKRMRRLDLSSLTLALSGAEPVDPAAVEAFVAAAEPFGFKPAACSRPSAWPRWRSAGSFPPRHAGLVCDTVDRVVLERDRVAKPVEVDDPDDLAARRPPAAAARPRRAGAGDAHRRPGHVRGAARAPRRRAADPRHVGDARVLQAAADATAELFHDGWLRTGDLGLPARRRARAVRADQGRDHRRRAQRVPGGHRAGRRRARRCRPAT